MIALAALLAPDAPGAWIPVGVSASALHVFVERSSLRDAGGLRHARVRIGAAHAITGTIDLVYQDEEIDCRARTWRMTGYEARDAQDRVVKRPDPAAPPAAMLPVNPGTIGGEVTATVCAFRL